MTSAGGPTAELGGRLREAREGRGWTLQRLSERTRITVRNLGSLESGDYARMPAPVYIRGFVRTLAGEFGLFNCWQAANPDQPLHQTLRWTGDRKTPYHCDGLFVPKSWKDRLESCVVLSGDDWNQLSDHNPVIANFT